MLSSKHPSIPGYSSYFRRPSKILLCGRMFSIWAVLLFIGIFTQSSLATPETSLLNSTPLAGSLIISEFRVRGPNGTFDEFVEIYNDSNTAHTVSSIDGSSGYALAASDGVIRFVIPNGTIIPPHGHYLGVNSDGYSLASYPAGNGATATGDSTYTTNIPDNAGIALFRTSNLANFNLSNRLDAAGSTSEANTLYKEGTGYPDLTPFSIDYSFYRDLRDGAPKDTDDNAADFLFVDTNGTSAGAGQRLGAPGPENSSSPIIEEMTDQLDITLLDPGSGASEAPNLVHDPTSDPVNNSTFGTLSIRRTVTNNGSEPLDRIRFRIVDLTTFPSSSGIADLRPRTSSAFVVNINGSDVTVEGTVLEQPPSQPNGGGFNSTLSFELAQPLAPGESIHLHFLFGLQQTGCERVQFDTLLYYDSCATGATINASDLTCDSFTAAGIGYPADGYAAMRVWNLTDGATPLIDSFLDVGVPTAYVPISASGTYSITASFPRQPWGSVLQGRIYRTPNPVFGGWDNGVFQDVFFTCNEAQIYLPAIQR